jgi:hypothetical protein
MELLAIMLLVLGLFGAAILRRHLHEAKLLRLREITHKERMVAMERDMPVSDADATRIDSLLGESQGADARPDRIHSVSVHWVRLTALALGLTCLFGGMGTLPGLHYQSDSEVSGMWAIGLIPIFVGTGLLIFFGLSKALAEKMNGNGKQESR